MSFTSKGPKEQPEKDSKPKVDTTKYTPEKEPKKLGDNPTFNPNAKPRNKILRPGDSEVQPQHLKIDPPPQRPSNEIRIGKTHKIYSENDVRYWIQQYKHYNNFKKVQNHLREEGKKVPGISTIESRIKELIGQEKYKELTKKYNFNDAK